MVEIDENDSWNLHGVILPKPIKQANEVMPIRLKMMNQRLPTCKNNS